MITMNGRAAKKRRDLEFRLKAAAVRAAKPVLVEVKDGEEWWKVGPAVFNTPIIRDLYPPELKNALIVRREALFKGECPCGARWSMKRDEKMRHAPECVASDESVRRIAMADEGVARAVAEAGETDPTED